MKAGLIIVFLAGLCLFACGGSQNSEKAAVITDVTIDWRPMDIVQANFPSAPRPLFLYIKESGCEFCERMDSLVFSRPEVAKYVNDYFLPVRIDFATDLPVTVRDSVLNEIEFRKLLSIQGIPAYYFFDMSGQAIGVLDSEMDLLAFKRMLVYIHLGHAFRTPWEEFLKLPEADLDTVPGVF